MEKIFQPIVKETAKEFMIALEESMFFYDYNITKMDFVNEYLCEIMTEKFINGQLEGDDPLFSEEEFTKILNEIANGDTLHVLIDKGYLTSYEDENTEETFFLTKEGKEFMKEFKRNGELVSINELPIIVKD
jgi:hypothetical protein